MTLSAECGRKKACRAFLRSFSPRGAKQTITVVSSPTKDRYAIQLGQRMGNDDRALSPLFDPTDQRTVGQDKNVYHASLLVALIPLNNVFFLFFARCSLRSVFRDS